jgi:pSer/pThr/pTyr-binding forkhead associated (FHA) protein
VLSNDLIPTKRFLQCPLCRRTIEAVNLRVNDLVRCKCGAEFRYRPSKKIIPELVFKCDDKQASYHLLCNSIICREGDYIVIKGFDHSVIYDTQIRNKYVSKNHAIITVAGEYAIPNGDFNRVNEKIICCIEDTSRHGTAVMDVLLKPHEKRQLKQGDCIKLAPNTEASVTLFYHEKVKDGSEDETSYSNLPTQVEVRAPTNEEIREVTVPVSKVMEEKPPITKKGKEIDLELMKNGTPEAWLEIIKEAFGENGKIKLPGGIHSEKEGYRNLLIAIYSAENNSKDITSILEDKFLIKIAGYLRKLKDGCVVTVNPSDSTLVDLDETISIMSKRAPPEKVREENVIRSIFKFVDACKKEVTVEKRITLNPITRRAEKIDFASK